MRRFGATLRRATPKGQDPSSSAQHRFRVNCLHHHSSRSGHTRSPHWLTQQFIAHPEIPIFLTLGVGFWVGRFSYRGLGLGSVTGTLLVGVVIGAVFQSGGETIEISSVVKQVFFLLFLFALGYKLGPQFFSGLKGDGLPQA